MSAIGHRELNLLPFIALLMLLPFFCSDRRAEAEQPGAVVPQPAPERPR
jgi:hypothetical protein